jgi:hypothetical protein
MASKHRCLCGEIVRTNLYEGHAISLLVPEQLTDVPDTSGQSAVVLVDQLVAESKIVVQCKTCGTLSVVDNDYRVQFFAPVRPPDNGATLGDDA